jgi:hypothetical protein
MFLACNTKSCPYEDETKLNLYQGRGEQTTLGLLLYKNTVPSLSFLLTLGIFSTFVVWHFDNLEKTPKLHKK